jgi:hypothetical protein
MNELCNFDIADNPDPALGKSASDCMADCLSFSDCAEEMLGDGKCDEGIRYIECNMNICGWDWGDCGYCAQSCYKYDLEVSDICIKECDNEECSFQGEICVRYISERDMQRGMLSRVIRK